MLNPDGVQLGHYRLDSLGQNLNRFYLSPSRLDQPSIYGTRQYFHYLHKKYQNRLYFFMDLHAHAGKKAIFSFGNPLEYRQ